MHRLERQVGEEGPPVGGVGVDELDHLVHQEAGGVKIRRQGGALAVRVPVGPGIDRDVGLLLPVVGAGVGHGHGALETAPEGQQVRGLAQVPLAGHIGVIAGVLQQAGHRDHVVAQGAAVVGMRLLLRRDGLGDVRHAVAVAVDTGQQHAPGGRATGGGVVVGKTDALARQGAEGGCVDLAAVGRDVAEAQVIGEHQHDIGGRGRRQRGQLQAGQQGQPRGDTPQCARAVHRSYSRASRAAANSSRLPTTTSTAMPSATKAASWNNQATIR